MCFFMFDYNLKFYSKEASMKKLKKSITFIGCFLLALSVGPFLSCSSDSSDSTPAIIPTPVTPTPTPTPTADSSVSVTPKVRTVDLASTTTLSLSSVSEIVELKIPANDGENWTAELKFDPADTYVDDDECPYELGELDKTSGTGAGLLYLYVSDNMNAESHSATLSVKYDGKTPAKTVELTQVAKESNADTDTPNQKRMIGYGYLHTAGYASAACRKTEIFRTTELMSKKGINVPVDPDDPNETENLKLQFVNDEIKVTYREASGNNTAEIEKSLKVQVSGGVEVGGFSSEIEGNTEWKHKSDTNYQYAWTDILVSNYTATMSSTDKELLRNKKVIKYQAYRAINGLSSSYPSTDAGFKELIKTYGSYVVIGGKVGGKANLAMEASVEKITGSFEASAMLKANYSGVFDASSQVDSSYKSTLSNNSKDFNFTCSVKGGSTEKANALTSKLKEKDADSDRASAFSDWKDDLSEPDNCVFIGFNQDTDLVPLYELVDRNLAGGEARYAAFKKYFETQMKIDFPIKDQGSYVSTAPGKITVPKFDDNGSLIKDIKLDSGVLVAKACSEYIPEIDSSKRVTVLYPATNTGVLWNMGLYIGDENHKPHSVSWDGGRPVLSPKSDLKLQAVTTIYKLGNSFSVVEPDYLSDEIKAQMKTCTDSDATESMGTAYDGIFGRGQHLVKVANMIFQRDYWIGDKMVDDTEMTRDYDTNVGGSRRDQTYPIWGKYLRSWSWSIGGGISGWTDMVLPKASTSLNSDYDYIRYYITYQYCYDHDKHGGFFPTNWTIPQEKDMKDLLNRFNKISGDKPGGNLAAMFMKGGVVGLRLVATGYMGCWDGSSSEDFYAHSDEKTSVFAIHADGTDSIDRAKTYNDSYRMVINPENGQAVIMTKNLKAHGRDDYEKLRSKRGPGFPVILCKKIGD